MGDGHRYTMMAPSIDGITMKLGAYAEYGDRYRMLAAKDASPSMQHEALLAALGWLRAADDELVQLVAVVRSRRDEDLTRQGLTPP